MICPCSLTPNLGQAFVLDEQPGLHIGKSRVQLASLEDSPARPGARAAQACACMGRDSWCEGSAGLLLERPWLFPQQTVVHKRVRTSNTSHKWQKKFNNLRIKESGCRRASAAFDSWGFVRAPASFDGRRRPVLCRNTANAGFALLQPPVFPLTEAISETLARCRF